MVQELKFTKGQLEALNFLKSNEQFLILEGSAGVGKTTLIHTFIESCKETVLFTATTHKAVEVFRNKSTFPCKTLQSFLKLDRKIIGGKPTFVFDIDKSFENIDILVIDESSMLKTCELDWVIECSNKCNFRVIFVGDEKQLNPVEETHSPVFHKFFNSFELTEIVRHDNDIINLSRNLHWLNSKIDGEHFKWLDSTEIDLSYLIEANGSDFAKFITWSNRTVSTVNREIRKMIYGTPEQLELGETILLKAPFKHLYKNNQEIVIESLRENTFSYSYPIPYPYLETYLVNGDLIVLKDNEKPKHKANLEELLNQAKSKVISWVRYYDYLESFADYQYNHAVTVHKSQGSTYKYSFVNISEIMRNRNDIERCRMLYTAITRASDKNFFI